MAVQTLQGTESKQRQEDFGVLVADRTMEPRYDPGDLVLVAPCTAPSAGHDILFVREGETGVRWAILKRYLGSDGGLLRLRQFNPPRDLTVRAADWPEMYRVFQTEFGN